MAGSESQDEAQRVRCYVCGADITGLMSIPSIRSGAEPAQRTTCYEPDHCVDRLQTVRDAWRLLAIVGTAKRRDMKKMLAALERLHALGER